MMIRGDDDCNDEDYDDDGDADDEGEDVDDDDDDDDDDDIFHFKKWYTWFVYIIYLQIKGLSLSESLLNFIAMFG